MNSPGDVLELKLPRIDVILRHCTETAEFEYLKANEGGASDPVIELVTFDANRPHAVGPAVWERRELARSMDKRSTTAAAALREAPPSDRPFTIVVATSEGVHIFHRPEPSSV
jgi:hypothetical protein